MRTLSSLFHLPSGPAGPAEWSIFLRIGSGKDAERLNPNSSAASSFRSWGRGLTTPGSRPSPRLATDQPRSHLGEELSNLLLTKSRYKRSTLAGRSCRDENSHNGCMSGPVGRWVTNLFDNETADRILIPIDPGARRIGDIGQAPVNANRIFENRIGQIHVFEPMASR